jgi:Ca2+-binding RTX toxin-like protein
MADIQGTPGNDDLFGTPGDDSFEGNGGNDRMTGGAGNDTYEVDDNGDQVFENPGEGIDTIFALGSYILAEEVYVEFLTASPAAGTAPINLTGNHLANTITGNAGANILHAGGGIGDALIGLGGDDTYYTDVAATSVTEAEGEGNDALYTSVSYVLARDASIEILSTNSHAATTAINLTGSRLDNTILGNAGANILHGGGGVDILYGYGGDDRYYTDVAETQVIEAAGGGNDALYTSISYTLAQGMSVEHLSTNSHAATVAIDLAGNELANEIWGNAGVNILYGREGNDQLVALAGADILIGGDGADRLYAGDGNDILDGEAGIDSAYGGLGNDTYYVDDASDGIQELAGEGLFDVVYAYVSYTLAAGVEAEVLAVADSESVATQSLTGNSFNNDLQGSDGVNTLDGRAGNDLLRGQGGDDLLIGGDGLDTLLGGGGSDRFRFDTALGAGNVDTLDDFEAGTDKIELAFAVFGVTGAQLQAGAFRTGAAAGDADDRIIYDSATGALYFDSDGTGAAAQIQFATLAPEIPLAATDFAVI